MSRVLIKQSCPQCGPDGDGAGDNLNVYDNGSGHCFACGYNTNNADSANSSGYYGDSDELPVGQVSGASKEIDYILENGKFIDCPNRGLKKSTLEKYGVRYVNYMGEQVLAFPRCVGNQVVGFKLKYPDGRYLSVGQSVDVDMFGAPGFGDTQGKTLIITEGEIDCLSIMQTIGDIHHSTSLWNGCTSAETFCKGYYDTLLRYSSIVLAFDMDKPGQEAVQKFIDAFNQVGKVKVAKLPLKDANELLVAHRDTELKWAILKAETYKPKQIVSFDDIMEDILTKPVRGEPWPWRALDDVTHGFYQGMTYLIGGSTSCGKTTFIKNIVSHFIESDPPINVGAFFLEQKPKEVAHKLISDIVNKDIEQPDLEWWDRDELIKAANRLKEHVFLFDPTQGIELADIVNCIYYFVNVNKVGAIIIDNLTILSENMRIDGKKVSENEYVNEVGKTLNKIKRELNVSIFLICHLNKDGISKQAYVSTSPKNQEKYESMTASDVNKLISPPALNWESGRMPSIEHLTGGYTSAKLANYVICLARNTTSEDDYEFRTLKVKVVKTRLRKRKANICFDLVYDINSGKLVSKV